MMNWERYGLRIGVSEGSLSSEETAEAAVVALVGGNFVFPENTVVVSAVYAVSLSRPLLEPLKLEIQHCIDLSRGVNPKYLKFAIAPVDTPSLPYQFSIVEGGEFSTGEWYGSINREKFCLVCIVGDLNNGRKEGGGEHQNGGEGEEGAHQQEGGNGQEGGEGENHHNGGGEHQNGGGDQHAEEEEQGEGNGQQQQLQQGGRNDEEDREVQQQEDLAQGDDQDRVQQTQGEYVKGS